MQRNKARKNLKNRQFKPNTRPVQAPKCDYDCIHCTRKRCF